MPTHCEPCLFSLPLTPENSETEAASESLGCWPDAHAAWWVSHKINFRPTKRERTCFGEQIFIYFNTNLVNLHLDTNWPPITTFGHHFNFLARMSQNWMYSKEYIYAAFKNQMKPSQETSEANIGFRHTLMPPTLECILPRQHSSVFRRSLRFYYWGI